MILLSVPLFVFLGALIEMTGMARAMVNFLASLLGHVRGGLSYVLLFAPPFGVGYYTACAIGKVPADEEMRAIWIYMAALIAGLIIVAAVPWLSVGFLP